MALIGGTASFKMNGRSFSTDGEFNITLGGIKNEPVTAADGVVHFVSNPMPSKITGKVLMLPGLNTNTFKDQTNIQLQIQAKNGTVYLQNNAFFSGEGEVDVKAGTFSIEFTGAPIKVI